MKKKIFLIALMVALFVCLFAVSASAARVENYEDTFTLQNSEVITHYQKWQYTNGSNNYVRKRYQDTVTLSFVDENGNSLAEVAMWEYDEDEGRYYSLVWYISDYEFTFENQTYTDENVGTQTYPKYTAAKYTLSKARAVDLRYVTYQYGTTYSSIQSWTESRTLKSLKGIYFTNGTEDTSDDIKLQDSVGIGRDTDNYGYYGYDAQFAASGNKIVVANFRDCDFQRDVEGNYGTSNTWSSASALQCLWYPDTMLFISAGIGPVYELDLGDGMEIIGCQILRDNKRVKEIVIPNSALYLNNEAFRGSDLTKLTIGEGLLKHGNDPFLYTGGSDNIVISRNVLTKLESSIPKLIASHSATVYFDGNLEEATTLMEKIISQDSNYNNKITLVDYKATTTRGDLKNVVIFYNYNRCEAFYSGIHKETDTVNGSACYLKDCERCDVGELYIGGDMSSKTHSFSYAYAYNNGFTAVGALTSTCANAGCNYCAEKTPDVAELAPIFKNLMYSKREGTEFGIVMTYEIDNDALAVYKSGASTTVNFGVVAIAEHKYNSEKDLVKADGTTEQTNIILADISDKGAKTVELVIKGTGDQWDAHKATPFYILGYYIDGNTVNYFQSASKTAVTDLTTITFESTPAEEVA